MSTTHAESEIKRLRRERDAALAARDSALAERDRTRAAHEEARASFDETLGELARKLRLTQEEVEYLRRRLFGRRSEKSPEGPTLFDLDGADQTSGPPEVHPPAAAESTPDDEGSTLSDRERRQAARAKRGRRPLPENLPRVRVEVPLEESECRCRGCGGGLVKIGEEASETLHYRRAHYEVRVIVLGRYACKERCGEGGVVSAAAPPRPIPGSYAGASVVADVVVAKFADHQPLTRKATVMRRAGVDISRSTLCDWIAGAAAQLRVIAEAIRRAVLAEDYVQADESPVDVLSPAGGPPRTGYFFAYRAIETDEVFYDFRMSRGRDGPTSVLGAFRGTLQVDGYAGYEEAIRERGLVVLNCNAHARRKFVEALDSAPREAGLVIVLYRRLYAIEAEAREMTARERHELRRQRSRPVLAQLARTLRGLRAWTSPGTRLGRAIAYTLERWKRLTRYLDDGRYEIDSNSVERAMRGIAMGRRAWLFCGNESGGQRAAVLYTLVENCRRAGIDPFDYLCDVLERLPRTPLSRVAELTPRNWAAARRG